MADRRILTEPRVLNPDGELVIIPTWLIRQLDRMKMLYWNRKAKRYQMSTSVLSLLWIAQHTSGFVHKPLRALNLAHAGGKAKDSGITNPIVRALGADCRGLNISTAETRALQDELREPVTPATREFQAEFVVDQIVKE